MASSARPRTCHAGPAAALAVLGACAIGSAAAPDRSGFGSGFGSLAELSDDGRTRIALPSGETRTFLQDGDELILRARARRDGFATLGFGDCSGVVLPAPAFA